MRVLFIGGGGREHALAWGLGRSGEVDEIIAAPGNPGLAELGRGLPVDPSDPGAIAALADEVDAGLVVVGPEVPLVAGAICSDTKIVSKRPRIWRAIEDPEPVEPVAQR